MKIYTAIIAVLMLSGAYAQVDLKQVKCLVCRVIVDEFKQEVDKIDPSKNIEIGQYRLDSKGNAVQKTVPLSSSEIHLSGMLDSICKKMENYVRATYKSNGKLTLLQLMSDDGLNPLLSAVDIIQDGDLNKSLEYFCTEVVNDFEESFIEAVNKNEKNAKVKICTEEANYCDILDDSDDDNDEPDSSQDYDDAKTEL